MTDIIRVRVEGDGSYVKLIWDFGPANDPWSCVYFVERGSLRQQSEFVRAELRKLATISNVSSVQYGNVLHGLISRGSGLRRNLFSPAKGVHASTTFELQSYIEEAARTWADPAISVLLCDETVHVPWGFIPVVATPRWPRERNLEGNIRDFDDLWIGCFRLVVKYQVNHGRLPKLRLEQHDRICAVHEDLFAGALAELRRKNNDAADMLDHFLSGSFVNDDWEELRSEWSRVNEHVDSIIYFFGHSNGDNLSLKDNCEESIQSILPVSQFSDNFWKSEGTNSASVVVLNGCRTAAPTSTDPWPPSFLKATRGPGFYGFVGTETQVPNDRACLFGAHLLKRLCGGEEIGQAFDALRDHPDLFPLSLVFTCFANRDFSLPRNAFRPSPKAEGEPHAEQT